MGVFLLELLDVVVDIIELLFQLPFVFQMRVDREVRKGQLELALFFSNCLMGLFVDCCCLLGLGACFESLLFVGSWQVDVPALSLESAHAEIDPV